MALGHRGGGRARLDRRRQRDTSSDTLALCDRVDEIGGKIAQHFSLAARPGNFQRVYLVGRAQAKVRPQVVLREIAGAGSNFIELHDLVGVNSDPRADGGTIALGSNQVKGNAVVAVAGLVDQQRRRLADVEHQNVHVAVVINVAKSSAAA
jgi:hypothetical protein